MKNEIDAIVDDLLSRWHQWRHEYKATRGYAGSSAMFRDSKTPWSAYDRENGVTEAATESSIMRAVDAAIDRLSHMHRLCILFEARELCGQPAVWCYPRMPTGEALEIMKIEARTELLREFHKGGLVGA